MKLSEIKERLGEIDFSNIKQPNKHEKIVDAEKFVNSHIHYLESNSGNKAFKPYYDRLLAFVKANI